MYGLAAACVVASTIFGLRGAYATLPVDEAVSVLCLIFAAVCAGYAARRGDLRRRIGWLSLTTALLGWAVGEVIWAVYDVRPQLEHAVHPATAEVTLLVYPVGVMMSLTLLSHVSRHSPRRLVLDGLILATSLFVISWVFVIEKQLGENTGSRLPTLAQVFADVVIMTTGLLMLSRVRPGDLPSRGLLAAGATLIAVADITVVFETGLGSYHAGALADLGRVAGLGLMAVAAIASVTEKPMVAPRDVMRFRIRMWLPYLPLLVAAVLGWVHNVARTQHSVMAALLGILVAAVLLRQFVVLVENQALLAEVAREAFRDSLTGLPNRAQFLHRLEQGVARRGDDAAPIAVLCLDLDNFKSVNDALGHPAGDELLIRVAERLSASLKGSGIVARLGGDEFAVLVEGSVEEAQAVAQRILDAFNAAVVIDGVPVEARPSIGLTAAGPASDCTVDQLLRHADLAMYAAKREGGQCIRSFVPDAPFSPSDDSTDALTLPGASAVATPALIAGAAAPSRDQSAEASTTARWPPSSVQVALVALAFGVTAYTALSILDPDAGHSVLSSALYPALNLSAAALIGLRAYRVVEDRSAWALIAAGMALSAMGDVVYALRVPAGQSPSVADPEYLAYYPFVYAGLVLLMRARLKRVPVPLRLDCLVCALTVAAVAAALRAGPFHAAATRAPATVLVGLVYPWGDLILLTLAAGIMPIIGWRNNFRWLFLVAGLALFAVADTAYLFETSAGSYRVGSTLDALWPLSSLLVASASWARSSSVPAKQGQGIEPYVKPIACTVVALGVVVLAHDSRLAATLAALSLVATAARFSVTFRDISVLAENHKHAMTDDVTGLPNRRSLATALTASSDCAPAASARQALLLLTLHEFREINDSVGQRFGDELLRNIAKRLAKTVRDEDLLARVSDDEFAVLLAEGSDLITARAQAGRLLEALSEPFALDPITLQVDARIAIALCPDHCDHPQELLTRAETAIPQAESVKSKIAVYDSTFETYRDNDPNVVEEIRAALLNGDELTLYYQPKVNALDGSVHSVEALLRWQHPTRGLLSPEEFLPAAERAGLMRKIANRTFTLALQQLRIWREQGLTLAVAVNLSTTNLLDLELVGTIERLLRSQRLPSDALIVEITESALVDSVRSRNTVAELQRLGLRISLDDYGTGWSSLARLQDVSVDELKLDRVFVARLAHDPRSVAIVRSTVALAHSLGADLVAEGVEDEITLNALRRYGCTITQGFVHSPPLPADELEVWIAGRARHHGTSWSHVGVVD
ncbi:diguanylate phosphodiesterase [Mycobacterium parmense]|nr:diguanylate cyclase [Mycobacterium parmense]ORW58530.1 diguanylate phosphodiesterase [Mycobacterium parmense]